MSHETEDERTKAFRTFWPILAGSVPAFFLGMITHRATQDNPLPMETLEWILKNGAPAFFLASLVVVGGAYATERKGRISDAVRCAREAREEREQHVADLTAERRRNATELKEERQNYRTTLLDLAPLLKKLERALNINSEVVRGHAITEAEKGQIGETPSDPIKLPPKGPSL